MTGVPSVSPEWVWNWTRGCTFRTPRRSVEAFVDETRVGMWT